MGKKIFNKLKVIDIGMILLYCIIIFTFTTRPLLYGVNNTDIQVIKEQHKENIVDRKVIKVAIILSYSINHPCGRLQQMGIIDKLKKYEYNHPIKFEIECYYMQTNTTNISSDKILAQQQYAVKFIKNEISSNFIITVDDAAFKYIGAPLSKKHIMVFFTGLNNKLSFYKGLYDPNYVSGIQEVITINKLIQFLSKQKVISKNILLLCSDTPSITETAYTNSLIDQLNKANLNYNIIKVDTREDLINLLQLYNNSKQRYLMFINIQRLLSIYNKKYIGKLDIFKIFKKYNKNNIEVLGNFYGVKKFGLAMSNGPNFYKMGYDLANLLIMYLSNNNKLEKPIIINSSTIITINYNKFKVLYLEDLINNNFNIIQEIY